ncbi:hypothetical protein [Natronoglycomyces albus]|uniref:Uncharacterized protein n=1 Tax=Natronoglycomyces albus TaxID=2811108 RepID=A0A895XV12_9ACTN|nr:hypothetical protein [Natronoglycomyces albus]QSB06366.1 hypothetical protein JQS30_05500 [Natronoglycomyces albus]
MRDSDQRTWHWGSRFLAGVVATAFVGMAVPVHAQEGDDDDAEGDPSGGEVVCEVADDRLANIAGIAPADNGYWVLPDSSYHGAAMEIFRVDASCLVHEPIMINHQPREPEDLAMASDGYLWAADTGDQLTDRPQVAVTRVNPNDASDRQMFRFVYPDGPKHVDTMLLTPDDSVVFLYNDGADVVLYSPPTDQYLEENTPLERVATVSLEPTDTGHGGTDVSGAAMSPDGERVVLRTASDAYEWDIDGDIFSSLEENEPRITPLPGQTGGTIAYDEDGEFVTAGPGDSGASLRSYVPASVAEEEDDEGGEEAASERPGRDQGFTDWLIDTLGPDGIIKTLAAAAVIGLLIMFGGIWIIVRYRRQARERALSLEDDSDLDDDLDDLDDFDSENHAAAFAPDIKVEENYGDPEVSQLANRARRDEGGTVYGGAKNSEGSVYGAAGAREGGSVYGSAQSRTGAGSDAEVEANAENGWFKGTSGRSATGGGTTYGAGAAARGGNVYGAGANDEAGSVYGGAPSPSSAESERTPGTTYGATGAARGSTYGASDSGSRGNTYGSTGTSGTTYGSGGGSVYGGGESGSVYGDTSGAGPSGSVYGASSHEDDQWRGQGRGREG